MSGNLSIAWSPFVPWWVLGLLAALVLLPVAYALLRGARGALLRGLFALVLLLALANPAAVVEKRDPLPDVALVVVDQSASERIPPRPEQRNAAFLMLNRELSKLPDTEVRVIDAGEHALAADQADRGDPGTRLFGALRQALADISRERVAAVFLISDGQIHDVPEHMADLAIDAPVHLLLTGRDQEIDRRLVLEQVPSFGIVGKKQSLTLKVVDRPGSDARTAHLTISRNGEPPRSLEVPVGKSTPVEFELDRRGPTVLELQVDPLKGELTEVNNRAAVVVNGVRDRLRVLLVSGEPHPGERAWRNILKSDPSVDLVHFTILRPPEKQDGTPINELSLIAFPTRELFELKLDEFDLVIFDRYRRRGVLPTLYLDNVASYVENGGALLEASGPSFASPLSLARTPLGRILPAPPTGKVLEGGFKPRVTDLGHRHPVTAALEGAGIPGGKGPSWGRWFRQLDVDVEAPHAQVLMTGADGKPLLILDRVGKGRVAELASDHLWLWARGYDGGGPQAELVRRIAHWLMKEPDLEEEDLRARIDGQQLLIRRQSLSADPPPAITVTDPEGETQSVTLDASVPGVATARIPITEGGLYRVSDGTRTALAAAGALNPKEYEDPRASAEPTAAIREESGGGLVRLADTPQVALRKVAPGRDRHGRGWLGVLSHGAYLVTGVERAPLLPALAGLALALGGLLLAWRREGR
ncbi:hypothetical protein SAMN06265365_11521 [Tistlia consotensis]|uniref:Glutamine amidotransferase domain-containing protein n=1 Tax=Tistlia consotensis USBA 355 TaxID=560819 RepID=A0A1Y6C7Q3_9PROT|nr:hypothetical protein [Tistlia consotensis]SMF46638.1 hypothetical protein SAMN05428998_116113 [Tistlia consotensis USBA 355]SNR78204.1 hypothetical protein SAMN06265365_11521 [Tistlia consotensis]